MPTLLMVSRHKSGPDINLLCYLDRFKPIIPVGPRKEHPTPIAWAKQYHWEKVGKIFEDCC